MKNIFKSFMIALAAVALLSACAQKEESVVDPYATNFVYLKAPLSTTYRATFSTGGNWKNKPDSVTNFTQIRCTKPAPQDIKVTVEIDETMVEAYNAANGTEYQFLPQVELVQNDFVIKKGEYVSTDTLKTVITDYAPILAAGTQSYIVPIKMTKTSNGVLSESNHFYVFYEASMLFAEIVNNVYSGTKLDRSAWKIYVDEFGGRDVTSTLTDNTNYTDVYYLWSGTVLCIDLGAVYENIVNIGIHHYSYNYTAGSIKVEVSEDNVTYKDLGTYDCKQVGNAVLDLYDPQVARYIKVTGYDPISSSYGWDIGEVFVAVAE